RRAEQVGQWSNLPDDVLTIVLSHLFGKDYVNLLSVCRSWRSAPPPLRSVPNSSTSPYPSLFHFSGNNSMCKFYDPFYNGTYVAQIPDELIDARIFFSNYGWLLMCQDTQLFFLHPFANQRIDLPSIERHDLEEYGRMCFSLHPLHLIAWFSNFLDESNGELISICMGHTGEYVRIFRLNSHYEIRWEEVHNLGDEMIFASRTGSMCMRTHSMGNTIYFPNFDSGGNGLFYSLASRKFHSLGAALPRKDLYNTKLMLHCAWITPTALEWKSERHGGNSTHIPHLSSQILRTRTINSSLTCSIPLTMVREYLKFVKCAPEHVLFVGYFRLIGIVQFVFVA
ncbi:hypothetical protein ES288_D08G262900v1, partial [Gossypium darwinii]